MLVSCASSFFVYLCTLYKYIHLLNKCRYQRFLNRFAARKASTIAPELVEKFNDRSTRTELFFDFARAGECLESMLLILKRRKLERMLASVVFRPKTHSELTADWIRREIYNYSVIYKQSNINIDF